MRSFEPAEATRHFDELAVLHLEHFSWAARMFDERCGVYFDEALGVPLAVVVEHMVQGLASRNASDGVFYLVRIENRLAGMGGLHRLDDRSSELSRIYIRPEFRGGGHGEALVKRLIEEARASGDYALFLSSARFMSSAHRIYEAHGFVDCEIFDSADIPAPLIPHMRFMWRSLT